MNFYQHISSTLRIGLNYTLVIWIHVYHALTCTIIEIYNSHMGFVRKMNGRINFIRAINGSTHFTHMVILAIQLCLLVS